MGPPVQRERVVIVVAADGMSAGARVIAGDAAGAAELDVALAQAGVQLGVDAHAHAALCAQLGDPEFSSAHVEIAVGEPPQPGRDGWFEPAFHVGIQPGHIETDGTIDFYDREMMKPAAREQCIGWLRQPVAGTDGRDVRGAIVAAPAVSPLNLRLEEGVVGGPDGAVRATVDGVVVYVEGKRLGVSSQLVHQGDVDLRSGSLETRGSLTVHGDVHPSFSVRAAGDLVIRGSVDGGTLLADGNVCVTGGVRGGSAAVVFAQGDVTARLAERATIHAGGGIKLVSAVHCAMSAEHIDVSQAVRGGRAAAERSVVTHDAGSPRGGVSTTLAAAIVPESSLSDAKQTFAAAKERRTLERRAGGALRGDGARSKGGKLAIESLTLQREDLQRRALHAERRARLLPTAFVEVRGTAHAGVMIVLGEHQLLLEQDVAAVHFSVDPEGRVVRQSLK